MSRIARVAAVAAVAAAACLTAPAALAATGPYVALGDSYTAGPLVPTPTGSPILCGRSTNNYPQDVRRATGPSSFTDASCSSATTADMTQPQSLQGGLQSAPPQFDALRSNDALVTLGIGGNDAGLIGVAEECAKLDAAWPFGTLPRSLHLRRHRHQHHRDQRDRPQGRRGHPGHPRARPAGAGDRRRVSRRPADPRQLLAGRALLLR